ncbi:hypothetical protein ACEPAG_4025 [Sanghuangporus baumii]
MAALRRNIAVLNAQLNSTESKGDDLTAVVIGADDYGVAKAKNALSRRSTVDHARRTFYKGMLYFYENKFIGHIRTKAVSDLIKYYTPGHITTLFQELELMRNGKEIGVKHEILTKFPKTDAYWPSLGSLDAASRTSLPADNTHSVPFMRPEDAKAFVFDTKDNCIIFDDFVWRTVDPLCFGGSTKKVKYRDRITGELEEKEIDWPSDYHLMAWPESLACFISDLDPESFISNCASKDSSIKREAKHAIMRAQALFKFTKPGSRSVKPGKPSKGEKLRSSGDVVQGENAAKSGSSSKSILRKPEELRALRDVAHACAFALFMVKTPKSLLNVIAAPIR